MMIRAAIYARRSTDEHQAASLNVQLEEAKRYIAKKGWTLDQRDVFVDDAVSRAEFKKRPGLIALLNGAEEKRFHVVVVRDETRLGGDTTRTCLLIQDLLDAGAKLHYYFTDEEVVLDTAMAKVMVTLRNFASELEREKISQRTHEHLLTKARHGYVVGGRVYGYDNIEIKPEGAEKRTRVEYRINREQAEVVREIFRLYASGQGLRSIAKALNGRGIACPRVGKRGTGSWSPSSLRSMLRNERYRGVMTWNRREKTYKKGTKVRVAREQSQWIDAPMPELRIVDDELWTAAHRMMRVGSEYLGPHANKKGPGRPFAHLLSGLARCACCGGPLAVVNHRAGKDLVRAYQCKWYRERGEKVCTVSARVPKESLERAVCEWIATHVLTEEIVADIIVELRRRLTERAENPGPDVATLEKAGVALRLELDRLVNALATLADKPDAILNGIAERQARLDEIIAAINATKAAPKAIDAELAKLEADARSKLAFLQAAMTGKPTQAREVIKSLFEEPLLVHHEEGVGAIIKGTAVLGPVFMTASPNSASPTGFDTLGLPWPRLEMQAVA